MAFGWFQRETKEHPNGAAFIAGGGEKWSPPKTREYITEGYQLNVVVFRAVQEIIKAASSIQIELYSGAKLVESRSPVLDLLNRPTPLLTWDAWLSEMIVNRMLLGEMACLADSDGKPVELWPINPLQVIVQPGQGGMPSAYIHDVNGRKKSFSVDRIDGKCQMLFVKTYNPADYWRGQSPMMAAALSADTHNEGVKWNRALLANGARPSGLVRFKNGYPGGETIQRMREFFKRRMQGSENAGEIPMLSDDAEWVSLSQTARDMDFHKTLQETAKYVASALGVPLPLIDNDASTFNNLEQAKERLYTDTVIPILEELLEALNNWLLPRFGTDLSLRIDMDSIPALEGIRERKYKRALDGYSMGVLTLEESREMIGYPPQATGTFRSNGALDLPPADLKALAYGLSGKADF